MESNKFYIISYVLILLVSMPVLIITVVSFIVRAIIDYIKKLRYVPPPPTLKEMTATAKESKDKKLLKKTVDTFMLEHGHFPAKESVEDPTIITGKMDFLFALCQNMALDEVSITDMEKVLVEQNAEYKDEITQICHNGLKMRN